MHQLLPLALIGVTCFASEIADLAWLAGHWTGTAGQAQLEELWLPPKAGVMLGLSRTARGGRLAGFEFLRIEQRADGIYYVAQPGGRPPTDFKLTQTAQDSVVFENPTHDHPKVIRYRLAAGGTLVATVEGDSKTQEFHFSRAVDLLITGTR